MSGPTGPLAMLLAAALAVAACASSTAAPDPPTQAEAPQLHIEGDAVQGGLIRAVAAPGSTVTLDGAPLMVDGKGEFVFGFDRDATGDHVLHIVWPGGASEDKTFSVKTRDWEIQRVNGLPQAEVTPPPSAYPQIKREIAEKAAARRPDTKGSWFDESFIWPAKGPISGVFGSQRIENGVAKTPHYGVDIAAPEGTPILAPAGGIVTLAEPHMYFEGGLVFIDHGHGLISYMMHMSKVEVHAGQIVKQGEEIGRVGHTGRATGPHVHWGVYWLNAHIDPALLVPPMPQPPASAG